MVKVIMILVMVGGGVHSRVIEGFSSLAECQKQAENIREYGIKPICIEVK